MSSFGDDIRTISKYEELLQLIRSGTGGVVQSNKGPISGGRGVSYGVDGTVQSNATTGTVGGSKPTGPGGDKSENGTPKDSPIEEGSANVVDGAGDALDAATNSGSSDDLDSGDNTDRDGWYDTESVVDGAKDALGKLPPSNNQVLNTLTGLMTDDAQRKLIVHLRDAAVSFLAPSDRTSALESIPDPEWDQNYYYTALNFSGSQQGSTFAEAGKRLMDSMVGYPMSGFPGYSISRVEFVQIINYTGPGDSGDYQINYWYSNGVIENGPVLNNIAVTAGVCTAPGTPSLYCRIVAPSAPFSTDLGATQLGWIGEITAATAPFVYGDMGKFIPNPFDINIPTEYSNGASILDVKTLAGDNVRIGPLREGGFYVYYRDPGNDNLPTGSADDYSVFVVNNDRTPYGFITPKELATKLPI